MDNQTFSVALRLPDELYEFFSKNPGHSGLLELDKEQMKLKITFGGTKNYSGSLEKSEEIMIFSVDSKRIPKLKGQAMYQGRLAAALDPSSLKVLSESKKNIKIADSNKENLTSSTFKLHELKDLFTMSSLNQAINKTVRQKFGVHKSRGNEHDTKREVTRLFSIQKYWKIKSLSDETSQPEYFIRPIIKNLARKITSGPYKGYYELASSPKPNFP